MKYRISKLKYLQYTNDALDFNSKPFQESVSTLFLAFAEMSTKLSPPFKGANHYTQVSKILIVSITLSKSKRII